MLLNLFCLLSTISSLLSTFLLWWCFFWFLSTFLLLTLLQMLPFTPFALLHSVPSPPSLWPSPHCCLCLWLMHLCSLAKPFAFFHSVPTTLPSNGCQSVPCIHSSASILFVSLFCSLDSTCTRDYMVFIFL